MTCDRLPFILSDGIVQVPLLKSTSFHVAMMNSVLRTIVIRMSFTASFKVGKVLTVSSDLNSTPISSGCRQRSRGLNMAIAEGLISAAGLNNPCPRSLAYR